MCIRVVNTLRRSLQRTFFMDKWPIIFILLLNIHIMGILGVTSPLSASKSSAAIGLSVTAIAIAVILLASNFTIINAQQQSLTNQPGEIENGATTAATVPTRTTFQSTNDSFSIQVPDGWIIQDANNTGSALLEETTRGYGILAQLCPQEEQQQQQGAALPDASGGSTNNSSSGISTSNSCQGSEEVIHIIRYPNLDTRIQAASNVSTTTTNSNTNMTTDDIQSYHLQKLQEVGYRSMQIVNTTDITLNLTNPQTNETIATVPARLVEMAYSTNFTPDETRTGYFISTATNATAPNLGTTKGYAVFYEGNSTTNTAAAEITTATAASGSLAPTPLPPVVGQVFDSFELIAAPEVAQPIAPEAPVGQTEGEGEEEAACDSSYPDFCIPPPPPDLNCDDVDDTNFEVVGSDPHGFDGDNDGIGCEDGNGDEEDDGGDDDGADDDDGGDDDGADDDDGGDDDGADDDDGGDDDGADDDDGGVEFEGCVVPPGLDPGDVGC